MQECMYLQQKQNLEDNRILSEINAEKSATTFDITSRHLFSPVGIIAHEICTFPLMLQF